MNLDAKTLENLGVLKLKKETNNFPSRPKGGDIKVRETGNILEKTKGPHSVKELFESSQNSQPNTHIDCLKLFNTLSTEEKIKFIMEFQNIEINLTPSEILVFKSC